MKNNKDNVWCFRKLEEKNKNLKNQIKLAMQQLGTHCMSVVDIS